MPTSRTLPAALLLIVLVTGCVQSNSEEETGQFYELSGIVTDHEYDMPLVGANVELLDSEIGAVTGPDGRYLIRSVPAGSYTLRISHGGKFVRTEEIEIPGNNAALMSKRSVEEHMRRGLGSGGSRPGAESPSDASTDEEVFVVVEQMPELIGGLASLQREITYPTIAKKAGIEGRVIVQFVVDEEGRPTDPVVVRGIGAGCDEEAVRAAMTTRFEPGRQRGKAVKVKMTLPVTFKLS